MNVQNDPREHLRAQLQHQKNELFSLRMGGDAGTIADALLHLARLHGVLDEHTAARSAYEEALETFQKQKNLPAEAECLRGIGVVCAHLADVRGALVNLSNAAGAYKEAADMSGEALCHAAAAEVLRAAGDFEQAEAGLLSALELFRKVHAHEKEARILQDLGDVRMERGLFKEAREAYLAALPLIREVGGELLPRGLLHLSEAEGFCKNHDAARDAALEASDIYAALGDAANEARARWDLGMALFFTKDFAESQRAFQRTVQLFEALGDQEGVTRARGALETLAKKLS